MGGWLGVAGWVVGKSDFDENPVVSLDLDFGLRLRVCQYRRKENNNLKKIPMFQCETLKTWMIANQMKNAMLYP